MGSESKTWIRRLTDYRNGRAAISAWKRFGREVRAGGCRLLQKLDDYPDSVLVAGCQRSGTTMLARLITSSDGMAKYYFGPDDEHDAALLLSGRVPKPVYGRYCFQTTYLNDCYREYVEHRGKYRLIWVLRNPYSVVHSFLYNWSHFALSELFMACGPTYLSASARGRYERFGMFAVSQLERACAAYAGKTAQIFELIERLPGDGLMVVEYDDLVRRKHDLLPKIYQFVDLSYHANYAERIHARSLNKKSDLSARQRQLIDLVCMPVYERATALVTK